MTPDTDKPTRMTPGEAFDWAYWKDRARAADADRDRFAKRVEVLEAALREIKKLKSEPIGDTGFAVGACALLESAKRIAARALNQEKADG